LFVISLTFFSEDFGGVSLKSIKNKSSGLVVVATIGDVLGTGGGARVIIGLLFN
jgi:hypothetical protein